MGINSFGKDGAKRWTKRTGMHVVGGFASGGTSHLTVFVDDGRVCFVDRKGRVIDTDAKPWVPAEKTRLVKYSGDEEWTYEVKAL